MLRKFFKNILNAINTKLTEADIDRNVLHEDSSKSSSEDEFNVQSVQTTRETETTLLVATVFIQNLNCKTLNMLRS